MPYDKLNNLVSVHGGLTFSENLDESMLEYLPELSKEDLGSWVVGFDTIHSTDSFHKWPKEAVQAETNSLREQLENL